MNILLHIPHDGHNFPDELLKYCTISKQELEQYDFKMSDFGLNHITEPLKIKTVSSDISRLFCDMERYLKNEPMEKFGMGYCYSKTYDGKEFKIINDEVLNITKNLYKEYHKKLNDTVNSFENPVLLIDLHSFNKDTIPDDLLTKQELPDVCIGYNKEYSKTVIEIFEQIFKKYGYKTAHNYPYSGSLIPNEVKKPVISVMIEINRDLYIGSDNFTIPKETMRIYWTLKEITDLFSAENNIPCCV